VLRYARCQHADLMVAVSGDDATNIAIALRAHELVEEGEPPDAPLLCYLHISDITWCPSFRNLEVFHGGVDRFDLTAFNFFENCARGAFARNPLDQDPQTRLSIGPEDSRRIHLVVAGLGVMGESMILQAARIGHCANLTKPRITVVDNRARQKEQSFRARYPEIGAAAEISFRQADVDDPDVRQEIAALAANEDVLLTVAICIGHATRALSWALNLPAEVRDHGIQVLVRLADERFMELARDYTFLSPFGAIDEGCDLAETRDVMARAIHADYCRRNSIDASWDGLDHDLRDSNRQAADHIAVKLRAIGCKTKAGPRGSRSEKRQFKFRKHEVELLARMEHARWCAERSVSGWRLAPELDQKRKLTPHLVPFASLPADVQKKNRAAVRVIPRLLREHQGVIIVRKKRAT